MDHISLVTELLAAGETFCLATVTASSRPEAGVGLKAVIRSGVVPGSSPLPAGLPAGLRELALAALKEKESRTVEAAPGLRVFLDVFPAGADLLICGAGHIALPLARFALETGFAVTVLDDRPDFASAARFPGCKVIADNFVTALRARFFGPSSYAVVITRGHEHDAECLAEILPRETAYTGLIGSRRRVAFVLSLLGEKGLPKKRLDEVFTPIGLPIGSESPEEIALSIAAELVCVRKLGARAAKALRAARGEAND
jgi:xanthine dehydrogenase accessory factor